MRNAEPPDFRDAAAAFFDAFVDAFRSFDGSEIARRYRAPYLAVSGDGTARCFATHADIAAYFQRVVDDYHRQGCRHCSYRELEVVGMGARSGLATVTWELLRDDGRVLIAWRESYTLVRLHDEFRVLASVDHAAAAATQEGRT